MTFSLRLRRAAPLGLAFGVGACDVASFIQDPKPIFEQTWNLPADSMTISVASLLPPGEVTILPDSSAFVMTVAAANINRLLGPDCPACVPLNGTKSIKPNFTMNAGSSTSLPTDVVSATLLGGLVSVQVTNGLTFDPLRVKALGAAATDPTQQGNMVIVIRTGSQVIGKDSVNGVNTPFAPSAILTRPITLLTGTIAGPLFVDIVLKSPPTDTTVNINTNRSVTASASVSNLQVSSIRMNVVNRTMASIVGDSLPLTGIDKQITDKVVSGTLAMTITNPFNVAGDLIVRFGYLPGQEHVKTISLAGGTDLQRSVTLIKSEMADLFGRKVGLTIGGSVNSTTPINVTPKQVVTISNRLILKILTGTPVAN